MTHSKAKIQGKFYPLQNDEWVKACQELTPAQRDVLYYLRTLDPYGDRPLSLGVTEIARQLKLDKSTVSRALKALDQKGWIDLELIQIKAKILSQGKCCSDATALPPDNSVASEQPARSLRNEDDPDATSAIATQRARSLRNKQDLEPSNSEASNTSKTIKTYTDFIQTLSEGERENFLNFALEKCKSLPKLPELPLKWIEAHWQELYAQFKSTPAAAAAFIADTDWTQHPDWNDWLAEMREGVPRFVALGTCFDRKTRRAIADWADERGLIWGTES